MLSKLFTTGRVIQMKQRLPFCCQRQGRRTRKDKKGNKLMAEEMSMSRSSCLH